MLASLARRAVKNRKLQPPVKRFRKYFPGKMASNIWNEGREEINLDPCRGNYVQWLGGKREHGASDPSI